MAGVGMPFGICMENCSGEDEPMRHASFAIGIIGAVLAAAGYGLTFSGIPIWVGGWQHIVRLKYDAMAEGKISAGQAPSMADYYARRKKLGMGLAIPGIVLLSSGIALTTLGGVTWMFSLLGAGIALLTAGAVLTLAGAPMWGMAARNEKMFRSLSAPKPSAFAGYDPLARSWYVGVRMNY